MHLQTRTGSVLHQVSHLWHPAQDKAQTFQQVINTQVTSARVKYNKTHAKILNTVLASFSLDSSRQTDPNK